MVTVTALVLTVGCNPALFAHAGGHGDINFEAIPTVQSMTTTELWAYVNESITLLKYTVRNNQAEESSNYLLDLMEALDELKIKTDLSRKQSN